MNMNENQKQREALVKELFPNGIPKLWGAAITHFDGPAHANGARAAPHFKYMTQYIEGFLSPSTTGDGWLMSDEEILQLLDVLTENAKAYNAKILVGILKTTTGQVLEGIRQVVNHAEKKSGKKGMEALLSNGFYGFAVCPPGGGELTQDEIGNGLETVLELGYPTALYQLPQFTHNEMSPELVARLAGAYPNFIMFKDTSGGDKAALAENDYQGVFFVRGAEGRYAEWQKKGGGVYDGFLLSTVNSFPGELSEVIALLQQGKVVEAKEISSRVDNCVQQLFQAVAAVPESNPFANANKAADHFNAYGDKALEVEPPLLFSGANMPGDVLKNVEDILKKNGFFKPKGYLT